MDNIEILISILIPIITATVTVFATVYTVNHRISNENKENHKPYLILKNVESLADINPYEYHLTLENDDDIKNEGLYLNLCLENIGYGVATNVKFYNMQNGSQVKGEQTRDPEMNQKLFTTFDIASTKNKNVQFELEHSNTSKEHHILCIYQDLNHNVYDLIISINVKPSGHYDFYAYQPSSKSYQNAINTNKKSYQKINKEYGDL